MEPRGVTLLELVVVITILGLVAAVAPLALARHRSVANSARPVCQRLRDSAVIRGTTVAFRMVDSSASCPLGHVLFLPDGRVIGKGLDRLTGEPR